MTSTKTWVVFEDTSNMTNMQDKIHFRMDKLQSQSPLSDDLKIISFSSEVFFSGRSVDHVEALSIHGMCLT